MTIPKEDNEEYKHETCLRDLPAAKPKVDQWKELKKKVWSSQRKKT